VESQARLESDLKQLEKRVAKKLIAATSALKQLSSQQFACQPDALQAATVCSDQLPYHQLDDLQVVEIIEYQKRGRPRKDEVGQKHYQISATLIPQPNAMVMGLCLLVYSLGQRSLRQALDNAKQTVENQVGKSTAKPTLRWMFQCLMSIHLLTVEGDKHVTNLTTERLWILQFFGAPCRKYYLLS
jgi:transposase